MEVNVSYEIAGILISLILAFYYRNTKKVSSFQNKLFTLLIECNILTAVFDVVKRVLLFTGFAIPVYVLEICTMGYFLTHFFILPLFFLYTLNMIVSWKDISRISRIFYAVPMFVGYLILVLNPFFHWVFIFSDAGEYIRNPGILVIYGIAIYYIFCIVFILIRYRTNYSFIRKVSVYFILGLCTASMVLQFLFPHLLLETCAIAIGSMILFFWVENPRGQIDRATGVFNHAAFVDAMKQNFHLKRKVDVIEIVLRDLQYVEEKNDISQKDMLLGKVADYLNEIEEEARVYRLEGNVFCLELSEEASETVKEILDVLKERFQKPWKHEDYERVFRVGLCHLRLPEEVDSMERLRALVHDFMKTGNDEKIYTVADFELDKMERSLKISNALVKALKKSEFEMTYSPVYLKEESQLVGAEASVRFYDDELGYVYAEDIYNFAEKSGQMVHIGEMMFERVCNFISKNDMDQIGIGFIAVPIPTVMCLQYGMMNRFLDKMREYQINPRKICFQISEYTVSKAAHILKETTAELVREGVRFCLEDYGSGFTNIASVYELPFSVIKLNERIVKDAAVNHKAKITLEYTLMLANSLHMKTMLGGIEEKSQFEMIQDIPYDLAEGRYFLEQLDEKGILELFTKMVADPGKKGGRCYEL